MGLIQVQFSHIKQENNAGEDMKETAHTAGGWSAGLAETTDPIKREEILFKPQEEASSFPLWRTFSHRG